MHDHYGKSPIFGIGFRAIRVVSRKPLQSAIYGIAFFESHMDQTLQSQRYFFSTPILLSRRKRLQPLQ